LADGAGGTKNSQALHGAEIPSFRMPTWVLAGWAIADPGKSFPIYRLSYLTGVILPVRFSAVKQLGASDGGDSDPGLVCCEQFL
jgi:hypothetical protein